MISNLNQKVDKQKYDENFDRIFRNKESFNLSRFFRYELDRVEREKLDQEIMNELLNEKP